MQSHCSQSVQDESVSNAKTDDKSRLHKKPIRFKEARIVLTNVVVATAAHN